MANLVLDVKGVAVSGEIRLNGAVPGTGPSCASNAGYPKAYVVFTDEAGTLRDANVRCDSGSFAFSTSLPPGRYAVKVQGSGADWATIPDGMTGVAAVTISGPTSGLLVDVKAVAVSGTIRLNGAVPETGTSCPTLPGLAKTYAVFTDGAGTTRYADVRCDSASFAFNTTLPPGNFAVKVNGNGQDLSSIPDAMTSVEPVTIAGATSGLVLDVRAVAVSGTIRLNGAVPGTGPSCATSADYTKAYAVFSDAAGTMRYANVRCDSASYAFSTTLPPGSYAVKVNGSGDEWAALPAGMTGVAPVTIAGTTSGLVLDVKAVAVSGNIRLNGAVPGTGPSCAANGATTKAYALFTSEEGTARYGDVRCDSASYAFSATLPPGTYAVRVYGGGPDWSALPNGMTSVAPVTIVVATGSLVLDAKTVPISGALRLNGAVPGTGTSCAANPGSTKAYALFTSAEGTSRYGNARCDSAAYSFDTTLPPGTYAVTVYGGGPDWTALPNGTTGVVPRLEIR